MYNEKSNFDVVIVGAGPAGLRCAIELNNSNVSVLLIEKNNDIVDKVCGGGLTGSVPRNDYPEEKTKTFEKQIIYFKGKRHEIPLAIGLRTVNRDDLGKYLFAKIENSKNITILKDTKAERIEKDKIFTNKGIFYYKWLVGADGSSSVVRQYLGLPFKILTGMRYKSSKLAEDLSVFFDSKLLRAGGYLWIFPHIDYTNVGIGFDPKYLNPKTAKELLMDFLKKNNLLNNGSADGFDKDFGTAPINCLYKGSIFGNIFLIGDAAGLTSRATGEGILPALVSGKETAKKILNPDYGMPEFKKILTIKKKQERFNKILEMIPFGKDKFFEKFINSIKNREFQFNYFGKPKI